MWLIYVIVCLVTGKKYVGQTKQSLKRRWQGHLYSVRSLHCPALSEAILKHGASNFEIKLLDVCDTQEEADATERRWIAELKTLVPNGYNLDSGGWVHKVRSESTRRLLSENARAQIMKLSPEERSEKARLASITLPTAQRVENCKNQQGLHEPLGWQSQHPSREVPLLAKPQ